MEVLPVDVFVLIVGRTLDANMSPINAADDVRKSGLLEEFALLCISLLLCQQSDICWHLANQRLRYAADSTTCSSLVDAEEFSDRTLKCSGGVES